LIPWITFYSGIVRGLASIRADLAAQTRAGEPPKGLTVSTIHKMRYRPENHRPLPPRYDLDELHGTTARRLPRTEVLLPRTGDPFAMLQTAHDPGTSQPLLVNCNPAI
jgi:hypothetical protein